MFFMADFHANKENNPDGLPATSLSKIGAEKWNSFTDEEKKKYDALIALDQQRYNKQLDEIRNHGYFINEDGIKSTQVKFSPDTYLPKKVKTPN